MGLFVVQYKQPGRGKRWRTKLSIDGGRPGAASSWYRQLNVAPGWSKRLLDPAGTIVAQDMGLEDAAPYSRHRMEVYT
jgi:hypothetical protein